MSDRVGFVLGGPDGVLSHFRVVCKKFLLFAIILALYGCKCFELDYGDGESGALVRLLAEHVHQLTSQARSDAH